MTKSSKALGYILAALSVFFWGITFVCTKSLLKDFSPLEILFVRFFLAYIALWIIHPKWEKIEFKDNWLYFLAGLSGIVVYQFSENIAINFTSASNVSVIVSICPMFTALFSQIFLKEKNITPFFVIGFVIAIFGVFLVSFNGGNSVNFHINPKGDLIALLSAVSWGFYSIFVSMINKKNYEPVASTRRMFFFALVILFFLMIFGLTRSPQSTAYVSLDKELNAQRFSKALNWIYLCFLGIIASGFCFVAWNKACDIVGTVKVSGGIYLIPVVTIIFAFIVLGEKITLLGASGALLVIAGLFISGIQKSKQEKK
ncbi:MAG: DMT family transporter [Treponema sp.]|nr:DMT family transporter [Treponema sp.]